MQRPDNIAVCVKSCTFDDANPNSIPSTVANI